MRIRARRAPSISVVADRIVVARLRWPASRAFLVGLAGGVSVGKSTFSSGLVAALTAGRQPLVARTISGDGFLKPNARLVEEGLIDRKGHPESYDAAEIARFRAAVAAGAPEVTAPVYSHKAYDVVGAQSFSRPEVLIVEGLLAFSFAPDLRLYLDADTTLMEQWYVERFLALGRHQAPRLAARWTAVQARGGGAADLARELWREINLPLLRTHVEPQRAQADMVIVKGPDHRIIALHERGNP